MTINHLKAEISVEMSLNNAVDRMRILKGKDRLALINEYREWLTTPNIEEEVLIIRNMKNN